MKIFSGEDFTGADYFTKVIGSSVSFKRLVLPSSIGATQMPKTSKPTLSKGQLLDRILSNSVYSPESRLVEDLRKGLEELSSFRLSNLLHLIQIKQDDAVEDAS